MSRLVASRRLLHVGVLLGAAAGAALLFRSWVPAAAMIPLGGLLVLAIVEVVLPLPSKATRKLGLGNNLLVGDDTDVEVQINASFLVQNLRLDDVVPEGLELARDRRSGFGPRRGRGSVATYGLHVRRRGQHRFDSARIARTSALGLFERSRRLDVATHVVAMPTSAKYLNVRVRPRPPTREGLATHSLRRGPGDEFFALRQYLPGDSIGDINWKATARLNRVITNEFLPDEPPRYVVYVDTRAAGAEQGQEDVFERTTELASILIEALLDSRAQVGLVLLSYHSLFLVPGSGAMQLRRLRQMLVDAKPGLEASLHELVLAGVPHLPARADAILITPNVYDATLSTAVSFLRRRHGRCSVLAPGFPEPVGVDMEMVAARAAGALLNAEQLAALSGIRGYADHTAQWPPGEPIAITLSRLQMTGRTR